MTKLVLSGCSWSCGEWWFEQGYPWKQWQVSNLAARSSVIHAGMTEFLRDTFDIINISQSASSNWENLWTMRNFYENNPQWQSAHFVWFQTDFLRPQGSWLWQVDYEYLMQRHGLMDFYQASAEKFYVLMNEFADTYDKVIYICGGLADIDASMLKSYPNLVPLNLSWIKLLCENHEPSIVPVSGPSGALLTYLKKTACHKLLTELFDHMDLQRDKFESMLLSGWFGPCVGDFHPNRYAHKIMAQRIQDFLQEDLT